jgi:hypothetical protein
LFTEDPALAFGSISASKLLCKGVCVNEAKILLSHFSPRLSKNSLMLWVSCCLSVIPFIDLQSAEKFKTQN